MLKPLVANAPTVNILLVDDREDNLMALETVLHSPEYHLVTALSGPEALDHLQQREFAVVLLDVQMPGMDGLETARRIRSIERARLTPIILVTGMYPEEEHIRQGYEVGAIDFVSKPFDPRIMKSKVSVFVELYRKSQLIRAQEKLLHEASESRFRTIFEQSPLAIQLYSPSGTCVRVNGAWERLVGDSIEELRRINVFGSSAEALPYAPAVRKSLFSGEWSELPAVSFGSKWIESSVYPVRSENGSIREVAVILSDVSDRRAVEDELRRSRDQLQIIFERVADGILVHDLGDRCVFANDVGAKLFGFESGVRMVGVSKCDWIGRYEIQDESGRPISLNGVQGWMGLSGQDGAGEMTLRLSDRKSRRDRWVVVSTRLILDEPGMPYLFVSILRDITERRRTDENERFLSEATAALASSLNYRATLAQVTELATRKLANYCSVLEPVEGQSELERVAFSCPSSQFQKQILQVRLERKNRPADRWSPSRRVLETGRSLLFNYGDEESLQSYVRDHSRQETYDELGVRSAILVPVRGRDRTLGVLCFLSDGERRHYDEMDLTLVEELGRRIGMAVENARLYADAQAHRERLQEAVKARDEFISIASHELKTPLTSLILHGEMAAIRLEQEPLERLREPIEKFIAVSTSQIDRITRLIDDMLDVSRISTGKLALQTENLDLASVVSSVVEDFGEQLRNHGVQLSFRGESGLRVRGDRYRIEQVVSNLLSNAMKYGKGKPVSIRVFDQEGKATLTVQDQGIGIPPEHHQRVFERFERAVPWMAVGGLGLGLYIVKKIVEAHGGEVGVESLASEGATFRVALPKLTSGGSSEEKHRRPGSPS